MTDPVMLDATPLGRLAHRKPDPADVRRLSELLWRGTTVLIPEIADYEVRRSLLLHGLSKSLRELDILKSRLRYIPISTPTMIKAAELWAEARRKGRPTSDPRALDADVILAAQALESGATVVTENVSHLSRYVAVRPWR